MHWPKMDLLASASDSHVRNYAGYLQMLSKWSIGQYIPVSLNKSWWEVTCQARDLPLTPTIYQMQLWKGHLDGSGASVTTPIIYGHIEINRKLRTVDEIRITHFTVSWNWI